MQFNLSWGVTMISKKYRIKRPPFRREIQRFPSDFKRLQKKHKIFGFSEDFVLLMAPAGGFEPLAYRLGVGFTHCSSMALNHGKPLILLVFAVVSLLVIYGFFLSFSIVFRGRNQQAISRAIENRQVVGSQVMSVMPVLSCKSWTNGYFRSRCLFMLMHPCYMGHFF